MHKLKNLVAYITGGASGIGKAVAERIIRHGGRVCIADINPEGCNIAKNMGDRSTFCLVNVTQESDVMESLNSVKNCFGKINVIVNSAGVCRNDTIYNFKTNTPHCSDTFKTQLDVNLWGTFNVIRLAAGILAENKPDDNKDRGVIVNLASTLSFEPPASFVAYGATKSAIAGMTLPLARGFSSKGIRVVGVCPGLIETSMTSDIPDEDKKRIISMKLLPKRMGTPDEVAHLIQTIIENPIINGENIRIDSGWRYSQINDADERPEDNQIC